MKADLLEIKNKLRKKQPVFRREESYNIKSLSHAWRRATGRHSQVRHQRKGYIRRVEPGYGTPALIRGSHRSGLFPILIYNVHDLDKIDKKVHGVVVASGVGKKKAVDVLKKAKERGLTMLNVKDIDIFIRRVEDFIKARKENKESAKKKKESKDYEKKKKEEVKNSELADKIDSEDKKKQEKQELDKTLSKRQR